MTSLRFEQVRAAVKSGIHDIERFDAMGEYSKAMLIAYWRTVDAMASWEEQVADDKLKADAAAAKAKHGS